MPIKEIYKLSFSLYIIISLFTFMVYGALPAILAKNHVSPEEIGLLFIAFTPFALSFLYSGFVESYRKKARGNFKKCVYISTLGVFVLLALTAFLNPHSDIIAIFIAFLIMSFLSATVLICLNAIAVENTTARQKDNVNTIMLIASGLGGIVGIVVALFVYEAWGWFACLMMLAAVVLAATLMAMSAKGEVKATLASGDSVLKTLKNKQLWVYMGILICFVLPLVLCASMSSPLLVYIGLDLQAVGLLSGLLNCVACLLASPLVLFFIKILGFRKALLGTLIFEAFILCVMVANMQIWQNHLVIFATLFCNGLCFGGQFVFMYSVAMRWCEGSSQTGVDFSFLRISENLGFIIAGLIASQIIGGFVGSERLESLEKGIIESKSQSLESRELQTANLAENTNIIQEDKMADSKLQVLESHCHTDESEATKAQNSPSCHNSSEGEVSNENTESSLDTNLAVADSQDSINLVDSINTESTQGEVIGDFIKTLGEIFAQKGVDSAVANGYSVVFGLGFAICILSIFIVIKRKDIA